MIDLNTKLSENFYLYEFVRSQIAARNGIDNTPSPEIITNLQLLCINVLQPIRDVHGSVIITSGYRCLELNRKLGSSDHSDHVKGQAADIEIMGMSNYKLARWIQSEIEDFDQLILECYTPGQDQSGWVHISYGESGNKNEVKTYSAGKYTPGLIK